MDVAAMGQSALPIAAPAPPPHRHRAPASSRERTVYAAGGGRKFAFSFIFLILLPFFISLPPMLFWRISQGHWQGTLGLRRAGHRLHLHHVPVVHRADALADDAHRTR